MSNGPYLRVWTRDEFGSSTWLNLTGGARAAWYALKHLAFHMDGLPSSPTAIGLLLGYDARAWRPIWRQLEPLVVRRDDGKTTFPETERELQWWNTFIDGARRSGAVGGRKKAENVKGTLEGTLKPRTKGTLYPAPALSVNNPEVVNTPRRDQDPEVALSTPATPGPEAGRASGARRPAGSGVSRNDDGPPAAPIEASSPAAAAPRPARKRRRAVVKAPSKPPRGPSPEELLARGAWERLWEESRGEAWVWDGKSRTALREALRKSGGDLHALEVRARRLLLDPPDDWLGRNASPEILASRWNQLAARATNGVHRISNGTRLSPEVAAGVAEVILDMQRIP